MRMRGFFFMAAMVYDFPPDAKRPAPDLHSLYTFLANA